MRPRTPRRSRRRKNTDSTSQGTPDVGRRKKTTQNECLPLEFPEQTEAEAPEWEPEIKRIRRPIWTENKAKLIERYLYYFVLVTHHGNYIDGFAGPQEPENPDMWAAKLVLESEPRWLKQFFLFDLHRQQKVYLDALKQEQPERDRQGRKLYRSIEIERGDFNVLVHNLLASGKVKPTQATFCLLDQRTFECHWSTVKALAEYKLESKNKIELFYFLPVGWLGRAMAAQQDEQVLRDWWGGPDWTQLRQMREAEIVATFRRRFKRELGYKSVKPWPIYERKGGNRVMYYMIHATDHDDAPMLMSRAYEKAVQPKEPLPGDLFEWKKLEEDV